MFNQYTFDEEVVNAKKGEWRSRRACFVEAQGFIMSGTSPG
jgi:hypothetical protein